MITPCALTGRHCSLSLLVLLVASLSASGCSGGQDSTTSAAGPAAPTDASEEPLPPPAYESEIPEGLRAQLDQPFTGDFDEMVKRRVIRAGVTFNRTHYFVDKGVQRGASYEYGKLFEDELNKKLKTGNLKVHFMFVPLPRDQLASALLDGKVDLVMAQVTVTPEREKLVAFTNPTRKDVSEIVVTGPGAPAIASVEDLSGQEVFVRQASVYHESLLALNKRLEAAGKPPVAVQLVPSNLEDEDLLEMVNAGLIKITVVDDYLAEFWKQALPDLTVHDTVAVRTGGQLAVAVRRNNPKLAAELNAFIARYGAGTAFYNITQKRYLQSTKYVKNATSEAERRKFQELVKLFKKYSGQYDVDYLLMAAQGYQESGLSQSVKSPVGAIGVMQVMPATGKDLKVGDISQVDANIHAGVKYIRFIIDQYYKDEPMDGLNKALFAFASYNAGPGRIRQLRREAEKRGLDPNLWFGNVEQIASERIGRETVTYVSNIYKYYVAYRLVVEARDRRATSRKSLEPASSKQTE